MTTPAERAAAWRAAHPVTQDPKAQRKIVWDWMSQHEPCPYTLHLPSYEIRSKRTGRKQQQLLVQGVRLSRSVVTWFLLHGEYQHPADLDFAPKLQSISLKFALD
jgi:hypothetical protein